MEDAGREEFIILFLKLISRLFTYQLTFGQLLENLELSRCSINIYGMNMRNEKEFHNSNSKGYLLVIEHLIASKHLRGASHILPLTLRKCCKENVRNPIF